MTPVPPGPAGTTAPHPARRWPARGRRWAAVAALALVAAVAALLLAHRGSAADAARAQVVAAAHQAGWHDPRVECTETREHVAASARAWSCRIQQPGARLTRTMVFFDANGVWTVFGPAGPRP